MPMPREDLLTVRRLITENGIEMTPEEIEELMREAIPDFEVVDEPGITTFLRDHGRTI